MNFLTDLATTFPLMRGGGAFLGVIGLGIAAGSFAGQKLRIGLLIAGAATGVVVMAVGGITKIAFDGIGYPTWWQWAFLGLGVLVEGYLVNVVVERVPDQRSTRFWLWILFVVGVHFLILTGSHGPVCGLLGLACMLNAWIGLQRKATSSNGYWLTDGLLKIGAGSSMVALSY